MPDNTKFIEKIIDHWLSNKAKILSYLTSDCVYVVGTGKGGSVPFYGTYRGRRGVQKFFRLHDDAQQTIKCRKPPRKNYVVANDKITVSGASTYRIVRSGQTYESYWILIWQIRNNRIAGLRFLFDDEVLIRTFLRSSSAL